MTNQARRRALSRDRRDEVIVTCTHDPVELERCQARTTLVPELTSARRRSRRDRGNRA
jgi:hypothetical protein